MAFFRNSTVNLLNLHYGIHAIALSGNAFVAVYLLKSGVSLPAVFVSLALVLLGRFVIRPLVVTGAARVGLRAMLVVGTLLSAVQYGLLAEVNGVGLQLAAYVAMASIGDTVYWSTYHAMFAAIGDNELRGHQVGMREAIAAIASIASPLAMGFLLVTFGPGVTFNATMLSVLVSAIPLLFVPDVPIARRIAGAYRPALGSSLLFMADGWVAAGYSFAWQIALFQSLGESFEAFGAALALSALVGAIGGLVLGRFIDAGHGGKAVQIAFGTVAVIILLRAVATHNPVVAVVANALGALGACLTMPVLMTAVYREAKRAPCPLRFHIVLEGGWDIGGASGLLVAALLTSWGVPLWANVMLSLIGVAALAALLRRYYASSPVLAVTPAPAVT